eukprot:TRINITY_DN2970_c0_g1_i4.p4 TRINITY_DN2970_c0_g1~~TRINITY_DN2970_c0_g1_i4.p4  ORF type:complete len:103 (-),score=18.74 TRINITY_DN2970_c0_g1_i4:638-946(-)
MLYPREDKENKVLMFSCRGCDHTVAADEALVYRNEIKHSASEMTQIITDLSEDPTMPRTNDVVCGNCGNREAIFFQQQVTDENESQSMHFLCTHCRHHWKDG